MKGLTKGPTRSQPGLLFKTHFAVDMFNLPRTLEELGFTLNRAHRKENDGLGTTEQLMLVYEKGMEAIQRNKRWEAEHAFFGNTGKRVGFLWHVTAFKNKALARVPSHCYIQCGNSRSVAAGVPELDINAQGAFEIDREEVTGEAILGDLTMVRISVNVYPDMRNLIPDWVQVRLRHNQKLAEEANQTLAR